MGNGLLPIIVRALGRGFYSIAPEVNFFSTIFKLSAGNPCLIMLVVAWLPYPNIPRFLCGVFSHVAHCTTTRMGGQRKAGIRLSRG